MTQLSMPFVIVTSNGGPYDDAAFVAGATCGHLIAELEAVSQHGAVPRDRYVRTEYLPQVDLIAMRYGYLLQLGEVDDASGHQHVSFKKATEGDTT